MFYRSCSCSSCGTSQDFLCYHSVVVFVQTERRLRRFTKRKHQQLLPRKSLISMSRATTFAFTRIATFETLLPAVLSSITHCSIESSNFGHLVLCSRKLSLVFFTRRRAFSCFFHCRTIHSLTLNYLAAAPFRCSDAWLIALRLKAAS